MKSVIVDADESASPDEMLQKLTKVRKIYDSFLDVIYVTFDILRLILIFISSEYSGRKLVENMSN